MPKLSEYQEAVEKGAQLLDEQRPGWCARINLDELHLADGRHCILGQEYAAELLESYSYILNGFTVGARKLFPGFERPYIYGFDVAKAEDHGFYVSRRGFAYNVLTHMWKKLILDRKAEGRC